MDTTPPGSPPSPPPVFIAGVARSGTSILYRTLQQHPRFRPANARDGFDLTESRAFVEPWSVRATDTAPFRFLLEDEHCHRRFVDEAHVVPPLLGRLHRLEPLRRLARRSRRTRIAWWRVCGNDRLLRLYFRHAARARGVERLVEKTPAHVWMLPEIRATFPDAKVISTHRHPLDVFSSYRRRLAAAEKDASGTTSPTAWLRTSAEAFCDLYRSEMGAIGRELSAAPGGLLVLRYEEFTREASSGLRRVLDFVGEPFDESCLRAEAPSLSSWKQDPLLSRPIGANEKDWRLYVDASTAAAIEDRLADLLERWGYSRYTAAGGRGAAR